MTFLVIKKAIMSMENEKEGLNLISNLTPDYYTLVASLKLSKRNGFLTFLYLLLFFSKMNLNTIKITRSHPGKISVVLPYNQALIDWLFLGQKGCRHISLVYEQQRKYLRMLWRKQG